MDADGNLYGVTSAGGSFHSGNVYEIAAGSGVVTNVVSFQGTNGIAPKGELAIDGHGNLFGVTASEGSAGDGTVFEVSAGNHALTTLAAFNGANGATPLAGLTMDSAGNLYGTTFGGGASSEGTLFKMTAATVPQDPKLSFGSMPPRVIAGQAVAPIKVDVDGVTGQIDMTSSANVTLNILSGDGITVVKTETVAARNGVATFPDISLSVAGSYTLQATSGSLPMASKTLVIGSGAATQLVFLSPTTDIAPGGALGLVKVAVEDAFGNIVTNDQSWISLTIVPPTVVLVQSITAVSGGSNTFSGSTTLTIKPNSTLNVTTTTILSGGTLTFGGGTGTLNDPPILLPITTQAVNGVATFDESSFTSAGSFKLYVSDLTLQAMEPITIKSAATHLVFSWQPRSNPVGGTVVCNVLLEDDHGNLVTNDSSTVTVALSGAGGGSLQGTVSVPVVGGLASFNGLSVDQAGNYKLVATDGTLTAATSSAFTITPTATHLAFLAGPTSGMPGVTLAPVSVAVEDTSGTIVTNYMGSIELFAECLTSSFSSCQTLQGTTTVDVQNGIATFSNVSLGVEGTYAFQAALTGAL